MSAAENTPPKASSSQHEGKPLNAPPQRPSLRKPPPRPEVAVTPIAATSSAVAMPATESVHVATSPSDQAAAPPIALSPKSTNHPIAPPSEPMQYRAIGLVRGIYQPTEEQLNRGAILANDGTTIDAVLLGRVTSLIKKHIDLEAAHLWVVYPRTRQPAEDVEMAEEDNSLHLQIVGIWEPDTLGLPGENPKTVADTAADPNEADEAAAAVESEVVGKSEVVGDLEADDAPVVTAEPKVAAAEVSQSDAAAATTTEPLSDEPLSENYFSIRGEVLDYEEETETILVKIVQGSKRSNKPPKAFKLHVLGAIAGRTVGYFWEFDVERQGEKLVMTDGRTIRMVPPKKKKKGRSPYPRRDKRSDGGDRPRPTRSVDKPRIKPPAPVKSNPL